MPLSIVHKHSKLKRFCEFKWKFVKWFVVTRKMSHNIEGSPPLESPVLVKERHLKFFQQFLNLCPSSLVEFDTTRLTIAFFSISGIDILDAIDTISPKFRKNIIDWIYHLLIAPTDNRNGIEQIYGFQGGSWSILADGDRSFASSHLAMTYTGLSTLVILGDDLSRVDRKAVVAGLRKLQLLDGSFAGALDIESDMRFVYCAACISYILNDFSGIDMERMINFIVKSISYDGGIAQGPQLESHGGSTFCGVAALALTSNLDVLSKKQIERLKHWCILRQVEGFTGRPNKPEDTCYSFWVGGTLALLDAYSWVDHRKNREFVLSTQDSVTGGFAKWPDSRPDPLHAFFGLAGLSLMNEEGLLRVDPLLCITQRAHTFLKTLHNQWLSKVNSFI